jgi:DNA-binding Lrp family transcriptional regulator
MGGRGPAADACNAISERTEMDPILQLLQQNACMSRKDIANAVNLSLEEVEQRIKDYEQSGVILAYQAVVDTEKLSSDDVIAFIEVRITPERGGGFDRLAERIAKFDEVKSCWLISGGYDLAVLIKEL